MIVKDEENQADKNCGQAVLYGFLSHKPRLPWETSARRLWSLWDMINQDGWGLCTMYSTFASVHALLSGSLISEGKQKQELTPEGKQIFSELGWGVWANGLVFVLRDLENLGLEASLRLAKALQLDLISDKFPSREVFERQLEGILHSIEIELQKRRFAYIPPPNDKYFEQEKLFGEEVYQVFDKARQDIKDVGNCLAASLPTASVFHLMRVAEHGLRKLAKRLRVTLTHSSKTMPIEFGDWNQVVTEIKNKIAAIRKTPGGPKRTAKLELYSDAADHCEYMKDIWRNNMAHTRRPYSQDEAVAVLGRVRDFMQFLGRQLK